MTVVSDSAWPWETVLLVGCDGNGVSEGCTWCGESVAGESCEGDDGRIHGCCHFDNID